jgi:hypothetical protein
MFPFGQVTRVPVYLSAVCLYGVPGEEDLKWLPLEYPGNVRLIVSTTTYPEEGGEAGAAGRRNKSLIELRRRQWDLMEVKELSNKARKEILMSYLRVSTSGCRGRDGSGREMGGGLA